MDQVQIQCPHCKTVLLVKNIDGSSEHVLNCPKCMNPLRVSFNSLAYGNPSTNTIPVPYPQSQTTNAPGSPYSSNTPQKKSNLWLILLLSLLVVALAGTLVYFLLIQNKNKAQTVENEIKTEQVSQNTTSSDNIPELSDVADKPVIQKVSFSIPYIGSSSQDVASRLYDELSESSFVNVHGGMTGADFESIRSKDSSSSREQLKVENSDGFRYQYFFMGSNKFNGSLTGVAVSKACDNPIQECFEFENYVAGDGSFTWVSDGLYRSSTGYYVSPGYSKGRFYVYYYLPNAPEKEAAPRK